MIARAAELFTLPASTSQQTVGMVSDNLANFLPLIYILLALLAVFFLIATLTSSAAGGDHHETIDEWDI